MKLWPIGLLALLLVPIANARQITITGGVQLTTAKGLSMTFTRSFSSGYQNVPDPVPQPAGGTAQAICQGGPTGTTYTYTATAMPTGESLGTNGVITGTPTSAGGTTSGSVTCTPSPANASFPPLTVAFSRTIQTISSAAVTSSTGGTTINTGTTLQLICTATWNNSVVFPITTLATWAPTTFGTGGSIGLHTGLLTAGSAAATPSATCAFDGATSPGLTITVSATSVVISNASLPNGQINQMYPESGTAVLVCSGGSGTGPTFALSSGSLPTGLSLNTSTGVISGTATASGTSTPAFTCTRGTGGTSAAKTLNIVIASVSSNAATVPQTTISQGATLQATSTTTYSDASTANTTNGSSGISAPTMISIPAYVGPPQSVTTTVSIASGSNVCIGIVREAIDNTSTWTIADSASQTYTAVTTANTSYGTHVAYAACKFNSAALTSITVSYSPGGPSTMAGIIIVSPGTNAVDQAAKPAETGGSYTSLASGNITTTSANSIAYFCADAGAAVSTFTAQAGWTIPTNGQNTRVACTYQIFSAIQTALNTTLNWSPNASGSAGGFFFDLAGSATASGAAWTVATGAGICSVNSSGLITGLTPGTCTISATVGGQTGTTPTITVNNTITLQSITVTPANTTCPVGGTVQFTATGNYSDMSHQNLTSTSNWSSSAPSIATINQGSGLANCVASGQTTINASHN